jgi:hypothetical protein
MKKFLYITSLLAISSMVNAANIAPAKPASTKSCCSASCKDNITVLFVQSSQTAMITPIKGKTGEYTLTLKKTDPFVSFFADRPNRVTGLIPMNQYLSEWKVAGQKGFKTNPPNVALESMTQGDLHQAPTHLIGTLTLPKYDANTGDISYTFQLIGKDGTKITDTMQLGYTVLFIDGAEVHWNPGGYGPGSNS